MSRFPRVTETFVLREIDELERQGQPVVLAPLIRERPDVVHEDARPWVERALYVPFLSIDVVASNLRAMVRDPLAYLSTASRVLSISAPSPNFLVRTAAVLPKSVHLAERLREAGVAHVHAHFATHPTTAALVIEGLERASFSFTAHAHDLFVRQTALAEKVRRAAFVRTISEYNRDFLSDRYPSADRKTTVVHMGVDPEALASRTGGGSAAPSAKPVVLCVAALKRYKGIPVLVEACAELRGRGVPFTCRIVGDGPLRAEIEERIAELGLDGDVQLLGARTEEEVAGLIGAADVCALPSTVAPDGQMDGIPIFLMEAMAARRPVVASDLSGIPELVEDGETGLLVPPENPTALANAVERLLSDPALRRRIGTVARKRVERDFRLEECAAGLLAEVDRVNPPADPTVARLLRESGWEGFRNASVGVRRIRERPDSRVVELLVAEGGEAREVVLKVQRPRPGESRPPERRAAREHDLLVELDRWFGGPDRPLGVPRPLHLDPEQGAVVLPRCPGRPLDARVREGRFSRGEAWSELEAAASACGRWLARFQARPADIDPGRAISTLLARAESDLEAIGLENAPTVRERLREFARRTAGKAAVAPVHGDFWPGNVFVGDGRLEVIDFEGARSGLAWEDPAWWLVHLELFFPTPFLAWRWRRLGVLFLDAWLGRRPYDPNAHRLCRSAAALRALASARSSGSALGGPLRRRRLARIARGGPRW
ncbi:MAG: glycosyltransferase [Gemmatimonadota bacterium]|nr:glycosyltransferase [Gemmatimonadota bacterium]